MTFVIKEVMDGATIFNNDNAFDLEPYNYIMNNSSCFLNGELASNNYN